MNWFLNISMFVKVTLLAIVMVLMAILLNWPGYVFVVIGAIWFILTLIGSFHIRWNYHVKATHTNPGSKNKIALTFDDGPDELVTPQILALLKSYQAEATFFCIGKKIEKHPKLLKEIHRAGHQVANHSYSHSNDFGFYTTHKVLAEIKKTNDLIESNINIINKLFRPPFGVTNPAIRKAIRQTKMKVIGWQVRSYDTLDRSPDLIFDNIIKKAKAGDIILLHDTQERTVSLVEKLLIHFQQEKIKLVTVSELIQ